MLTDGYWVYVTGVFVIWKGDQNVLSVDSDDEPRGKCHMQVDDKDSS